MMAQNVFSDITGEMFAMTALNVLLSLFFYYSVSTFLFMTLYNTTLTVT